MAAAYRPAELSRLEEEARRLTDPAAALETLHWGRNYLYSARLETDGGPVEVVVKQFRNQSFKDRLRRRLRGSKAALSWRAAGAMIAAGVPTPEPVMLVESRRPAGPSFFVSRHLGETLEMRYLLRAVNAGREGEHGEIDVEDVLVRLARLLRRMHDAGLWHRDLSIGNVLLRPPAGPRAAEEIFILDLNRMRVGSRPTVSERTRDLCRLAIFRPEHQRLFVASYWAEEGGREAADLAWKLRLYRLYHRAFLGRVEGKKKLRGGLRSLGELLRPRRAHAHIPPPPEGSSARDRIVWDPLSDQPHQHAGRLQKFGVRLADARLHLETAAVLATALPRAARRYRRLRGELYRRPVSLGRGLGVCLRPDEEDPEGLLAAVEELGVRRLLLRLHPWQEDHDAEEALAAELSRRGYELAFALPQNRELVKRPERWRNAVEELAERFSPYGRHFQVGQAINRSKWGVWNYQEYVELATAAGEILRRGRPDVEILGPAVIDFEYHATAAVLNLKRPGLDFDIVSALLYVDRRGAPENRQAGFDTVDKAVLLRAIAETSRNGGERCWITEFNWPLREGPHSPAGREVAVDEEAQASYLVRYALLTLGTGLVERAYWWQLGARGYGLAYTGPEGFRRRPAWYALATLARQLEGRRFLRPLPAPPGACLYLFDGPEDHLVVGWSATDAPAAGRLPAPAHAAHTRGGREETPPDGVQVELGPAPRYFLVAMESNPRSSAR